MKRTTGMGLAQGMSETRCLFSLNSAHQRLQHSIAGCSSGALVVPVGDKDPPTNCSCQSPRFHYQIPRAQCVCRHDLLEH